MTSNSTVLIRVVSMSMVEHEDAAEHAAATSVDSSNEIEHRGSAATWLDVIANTATAQATKTVIMRMANPIVLCQKLKRARSSVEAGSGLFLFSARFSKFCLVSTFSKSNADVRVNRMLLVRAYNKTTT